MLADQTLHPYSILFPEILGRAWVLVLTEGNSNFSYAVVQPSYL